MCFKPSTDYFWVVCEAYIHWKAAQEMPWINYINIHLKFSFVKKKKKVNYLVFIYIYTYISKWSCHQNWWAKSVCMCCVHNMCNYLKNEYLPCPGVPLTQWEQKGYSWWRGSHLKSDSMDTWTILSSFEIFSVPSTPICFRQDPESSSRDKYFFLIGIGRIYGKEVLVAHPSLTLIIF